MENKQKNYFFFLFLYFFVFSIAMGQEDSLRLVRESDGIFVYKQKDAHENINRIVANMEVDAHYLEALCLIKDFKHQKDWIFSNSNAFCIDSLSPHHWIYYGVTETPWPFQDRDVVADVYLEIDQKKQELVIHSVSNPHLIPVFDELVRIEMLDSKWRLKKLSNGTEITLDLLVDVGGNVPSWLINMFSANGPFNTFKNMKKKLENHQHSNDCGYQELFEE
jgi:hypothetical protein